MRFPDLAKLPAISGSRTLCRMVEKARLEAFMPPDYLFASGNPGRYNVRGMECIYASEDLPTAAMEYERYNLGKTTQSVTYWIYADGPVLDLNDVATLTALALKTDDLFGPWRTLKANGPSVTQQLGQAVLADKRARFAGIRFPSDAARAKNATGYNFVFFRGTLRPPASLVVKDDTGALVQSWP